MQTRPIIITGNWKMHKTIEEGKSFVTQLLPLVTDATSLPWLAVPFTSISTLAALTAGSSVKIGAQNMNDASQGAFTGEIAAHMLIEAGASFVLLGHSERRRYYHEDNAFINAKVKRALKDGIRPVLCIGETAEEREGGKTREILEKQLSEGLQDVSAEQLDELVLAYEPVWAIGTGQTATPELAQEAHHFAREVLGRLVGQDRAAKVVIQYGGSVNAETAPELLAQPDIDGLLIGGASLSLESFSKIVNTSRLK